MCFIHPFITVTSIQVLVSISTLRRYTEVNKRRLGVLLGEVESGKQSEERWTAALEGRVAQVVLSVGGTCPSDLLKIEGLLTQGARRGRTVGEPVGEIFEMYNPDRSNGIRYHILGTRPDTEFNPRLTPGLTQVDPILNPG
jgi:hypothetical protein